MAAAMLAVAAAMLAGLHMRFMASSSTSAPGGAGDRRGGGAAAAEAGAAMAAGGAVGGGVGETRRRCASASCCRYVTLPAERTAHVELVQGFGLEFRVWGDTLR